MSRATEQLAPFAVAEAASRGRQHPDPFAGGDSPFELDRARILSSTAFRRLMHKTQVFVTGLSDHFRTRLTHTLEVVAQSQRLARAIGANARLAGAIALAHDLGHPPFGHAGEIALAQCMADHGGFEHNLQSLRVVDYLEHPYPPFRGLNLSYELRESLIKHHTRYDHPDQAAPVNDDAARELLASGPRPPIEGQIANLGDAIAYALHDTEDALFDLSWHGDGGDLRESVLSSDQLVASPLWAEAAERVQAVWPGAPTHAIRRPVLDEMNRLLIDDAAAESRRRIESAGIDSPDAARTSPTDSVAFSSAMEAKLDVHQNLLRDAVYRHPSVARMDDEARRVVSELFAVFVKDPAKMPARFSARIGDQTPQRVACDYIAGMTDRYCRGEYDQWVTRRGGTRLV
ncbi:MAG: deoxyguanosinetriphosphate triphosphohydrolase-like protein [Phycisphaerae bacterium]|nr:MAG: dNTP triphosphohydrolase [Planctomycetia bacterium]RIK71095.1 MAG: deoxyguanosinetriphosphate triphosphohydrolase [Planctomycetota bacterium]GJQ27459.1 MAG: deoxyguanosinetriphosphate triphosphohydrolase-like protein [Phycisphaerae bacterium]